MPTYEYICRACGHEFEEFQSIKADPIAVCPKCRKKKVERKIGMGGAVIFKGGGFYETDYRSEGYKSAADADRKASEAKTGPAAESGPASGSEAKGPSKADATAGARGESSRSESSRARSGTESKSDKASGGEPGARLDATSQASSRGKSDGTPQGQREPKAEAKPEGRPDSTAAAENKRIEARATHQSRIGRGVGNIVGKKQAPVKKKR